MVWAEETIKIVLAECLLVYYGAATLLPRARRPRSAEERRSEPVLRRSRAYARTLAATLAPRRALAAALTLAHRPARQLI